MILDELISLKKDKIEEMLKDSRNELVDIIDELAINLNLDEISEADYREYMEEVKKIVEEYGWSLNQVMLPILRDLFVTCSGPIYQLKPIGELFQADITDWRPAFLAGVGEWSNKTELFTREKLDWMKDAYREVGLGELVNDDPEVVRMVCNTMDTILMTVDDASDEEEFPEKLHNAIEEYLVEMGWPGGIMQFNDVYIDSGVAMTTKLMVQWNHLMRESEQVEGPGGEEVIDFEQ